MIYCAFYTIGTIYEQEADRLRKSLDRLNLFHDISGVEDLGGWIANTRQTAGFIRQMREKHAGPICYLDADAVVWNRPELFGCLSEFDIAVHYRRGAELLNGTVWLNDTPGARSVISEYQNNLDRYPGCKNEQVMLDAAINGMKDSIKVYRLPPEYCWIHDIMADDLGKAKPVIEHLQASRQATGSTLLPNRLKRLAEIGG